MDSIGDTYFYGYNHVYCYFVQHIRSTHKYSVFDGPSHCVDNVSIQAEVTLIYAMENCYPARVSPHPQYVYTCYYIDGVHTSNDICEDSAHEHKQRPPTARGRQVAGVE